MRYVKLWLIAQIAENPWMNASADLVVIAPIADILAVNR